MRTTGRIPGGFRRALTKRGGAALWLLPAILGGLLNNTILPAQAQNAAPTQAGPPLLQTKFVDNEQGWIVFGEKGKVMLASDGDKKALRFDYSVEKGGITALALPVNENEISTAKSLKFSVKADAPTTMACVLQEADGGRYMAMFHAPADKWQNVTLGTSDFVLSEDGDNPKDPNNKLDMDKVQAIVIADLQQILAAMADDPTLAMIFNIKKGARHFLLGEFTVGTDVPAGASYLNKTDARLDTFAHPQVGWMAVGETQLSLASGRPLNQRGMQASYTQASGKVTGFVRQIPRGRLEGKANLTFTAAAAKTTRLVVQVEEIGGGKYNTILEVAGGETSKEYSIPFADLKPADDSKDKNDKLDLDQVYQVLFLDLAGFEGVTGSPQNSVWISGLRTSAAGQ
jgi:hypothetical protein